MLGGTDGSSWDKGRSLASQDCDEGNDSNEISGGVGGSFELVKGDDDCVESGEMRLMRSVMVDQSMSCKESEESPEWDKVESEVDESGGPRGIGNCIKELRSCSEPKSLDELDVVVAPCSTSGVSRS